MINVKIGRYEIYPAFCDTSKPCDALTFGEIEMTQEEYDQWQKTEEEWEKYQEMISKRLRDKGLYP